MLNLLGVLFQETVWGPGAGEGGRERSITNNKPLRLVCNELVINGLALCESLTITEQL